MAHGHQPCSRTVTHAQAEPIGRLRLMPIYCQVHVSELKSLSAKCCFPEKLFHISQLCLSPHCIPAETFWISIFPQLTSIIARDDLQLQYGRKNLIEVKPHSEVTYFNKTISVAVFHNYKIVLSYPFYFYWQLIFYYPNNRIY